MPLPVIVACWAYMNCDRVGMLARQPVVRHRTDSRKSCNSSIQSSQTERDSSRSYVVLAVVGPKGALERTLDTGLGTNRAANMVAFAIEALKHVNEYILSQD